MSVGCHCRRRAFYLSKRRARKEGRVRAEERQLDLHVHLGGFTHISFFVSFLMFFGFYRIHLSTVLTWLVMISMRGGGWIYMYMQRNSEASSRLLTGVFTWCS
jgi:hypothetical protein